MSLSRPPTKQGLSHASKRTGSGITRFLQDLTESGLKTRRQWAQGCLIKHTLVPVPTLPLFKLEVHVRNLKSGLRILLAVFPHHSSIDEIPFLIFNMVFSLWFLD